jgi:hypothetical protein
VAECLNTLMGVTAQGIRRKKTRSERHVQLVGA